MNYIYNNYSEVWEELLATLEEMRVHTDEAKNLLTFLKSYCNVLLEETQKMENAGGLTHG